MPYQAVYPHRDLTRSARFVAEASGLATFALMATVRYGIIIGTIIAGFQVIAYISSIKGKSVVIFMERKRGLPVKTVHIRAYGGGPAVAGG